MGTQFDRHTLVITDLYEHKGNKVGSDCHIHHSRICIVSSGRYKIICVSFKIYYNVQVPRIICLIKSY